MDARTAVLLGALVFTQIFNQAIPSPTTTTESQQNTSDAQDKDTFKNVSVPENTTWYCAEGWFPYQSDTQMSCLTFVAKAQRFSAAESHCQSLGGFLVYLNNNHKETYLKQLAKTAELGSHWVGLYKEEGYDDPFSWRVRNSSIRVNLDSLPKQVTDYIIYKEQCGYLSGYHGQVDMDDCETELSSVCEKEVSCRPGTFGDRCERECHCVGEPCDARLSYGPRPVTCKYGCEKNWVGDACDTVKEDPEVKYYCINAPDVDTYVYIRIYTKGLPYRNIYGMTSHKVRGDWCNSTVIDSPSADLVTIRIPVNNDSMAQMDSGRCAGQKLDEHTFTWAIVLKENDGVLQEHDALFNIICDFRVADSLVRSGAYSIGREANQLQQQLVEPESVQQDVILHVVSAYSGQSLGEAVLGTHVVLEMKYALQPGSQLKGVHPFNCQASSPDGKHVKQLLDNNGCQVSDSPVQAFGPDSDNTTRTPWFSLFVFEGQTSVTFTCSFDLCFTSDCNVGCRQPTRHRRDTLDDKGENEVRHSTTRTIRVLPSIAAEGDRQGEECQQPAGPPASPPGYNMGPAIYLNPVTCSLFLIILLVFLCMYIAFIRTLRKSVYDIRREIEVRRSRDKFLHCGCVQQKDRDYIAPSNP
ncbi:hypothetical protein BsWGS_02533 [Bradybaena similaris]